jgi:predicted PolB exonuclease-like 3'-5' exonuclease
MLKNPINELSLFFDLEWVPDAEAAKKLFSLPDGTSERDAVQALWEHSPQYDAAECPRPFLKYMFSRVVSIAFLSRKVMFVDGEKVPEYSLNSLPKLPLDSPHVDEAQIIERFLYIVGERRPQLVGYNSGESDMQVLVQRGIINEIAAKAFCKRPTDKFDKSNDYFTRWDNECHLDLLRLFANGKMQPKLDEFAKLCGFPGKLDVEGDQVVDLWLNRDVTKIVEYNQIDTLNTYLVWLRIVYFCGHMSEEEYMMEQDHFRLFLENETRKPEKGFLRAFLDNWPL